MASRTTLMMTCARETAGPRLTAGVRACFLQHGSSMRVLYVNRMWAGC